jgi:hypothetical protein
MDVLQAILDAQGGAAARQAAHSVGLSPDQAGSALAALVPALAAGLHRNASQPGGLDALLGALGGGSHERYLDDPALVGRQETVADGNGILGHILGSKDASRAVASRAAAQTGIGADILKKLLPIAAALVMGSLSRQRAGGPDRPAAGAGLFDMLTPMLDGNRDGSVVDDILGHAGRLFRG